VAEKQHRIAARLLPIIFEKWQNSLFPTYAEVAEALGRARDNARTVAQACDLLDAAAARAGVPLLALWVVREGSRDINRRAFRRRLSKEMKKRVIERSRLHNFSDEDIAAIGHSLEGLSGLGNIRAWDSIRGSNAGSELLQFLLGDSTGYFDAIDDLGADIPTRIVDTVVRYARDPRVRDAVLARAQGRCELCGKLGFPRQNGGRYLETHHIIALASDGADRLTNVIALCAEEHREAHFGERASELEQLMIERISALTSN
jgi:hypothetical protein